MTCDCGELYLCPEHAAVFVRVVDAAFARLAARRPEQAQADSDRVALRLLGPAPLDAFDPPSVTDWQRSLDEERIR